MNTTTPPKKPDAGFTKKIYSHLLGEEHTPTHRKIAGVVIIFLGVGVMKAFYLPSLEIFHFIGDMVGPFIHGVGCLPFVENFTKQKT